MKYFQLQIFVPEGKRKQSDIPKQLHDKWAIRLLAICAELFGGATGYTRGIGVWRSPSGNKVWDDVTVIESWINPDTNYLKRKMNKVASMVRRMGADLGEKEVAFVVDGFWKPYKKKTGKKQ
jgi:hypothetical protein